MNTGVSFRCQFTVPATASRCCIRDQIAHALPAGPRTHLAYSLQKPIQGWRRKRCRESPAKRNDLDESMITP